MFEINYLQLIQYEILLKLVTFMTEKDGKTCFIAKKWFYGQLFPYPSGHDIAKMQEQHTKGQSRENGHGFACGAPARWSKYPTVVQPNP